MNGFKYFRSISILINSAKALKKKQKLLKLSSQSSTEPVEHEQIEQQPFKQIKLNYEKSSEETFFRKKNDQSNLLTNEQQTQLLKSATINSQKSPLTKFNSSLSKQQQKQQFIISKQNTINTIQSEIIDNQILQSVINKTFHVLPKQNIQLNSNSSQQKQTISTNEQKNKEIQNQEIINNNNNNNNNNKKTKQEMLYQRAIGLQNIGNTCYFNSALQCIINTPQFNNKFLSDEIKSELNPKHKDVAVQYWKLLKKMRIPNQNCENPVQLKQAISRSTKKFNGHRQEDSQEFLRAILTCLHEDLNRITKKPEYKELSADLNKQSLQEISNTWFNYFKGRDDSLITDYFTGQLLSRVTCSVCKNQSLAFDNFQDLSLAFPNMQGRCLSVQEMLTYYLGEEQINSYTCSKCRQQRKCTRQLEIWKLPDILVLHLKRFYYKGQMKKKITNDIKYDAKLDMRSFIKNSSDKTIQQSQYHLYGIVKHYGDLNFGHYFAECKHPFTQKWYQLNDSSASEIKPKLTSESDNSAYLLFYSRV